MDLSTLHHTFLAHRLQTLNPNIADIHKYCCGQGMYKCFIL